MDNSSNRRKTRSSGRKKANTKVADTQDTSQIPDGAEAKSKPNGASPGRSSPEPDCAICLGRLQNKSFTDRCFHMFCFVCLQEWSKVKAECPLCKQKFTSIIHNVRSNEDYDQYPIPPKIPSWEEQARNFRYHTTLTLERRLQINIPDFRQHPQYQEHDYTLQRPSVHNHMTTRSHWRRQRQASSSDFRRRIYTNNLRLVEVTDPRMRTREATPNFFRSNPACTHRLVPWLNRELNALLQSQNDDVQFILERIMESIKNVAITSEDFYQRMYPYIGRHTRHFMQEFENFARSPYTNIAAYDQHAVYQPQTLAVESDSDTDSILSVDDDNDDDDVIVISPSQEAGRRRQPSPPHRQRDSGSLTYRDLSPLLHRVRSLLEYPERSHLSVNTPGWDSPTPGPSWAETELSDSSAAVTAGDEETVLDDGIRTMGDSHNLVKTEDECEIDVENTGSNYSSDDSDSDSSKAGSDIVFVAYDRPWQDRSPILLSSSDEDNVVAQPVPTSSIDSMSRHRGDKKPQTDRHKKRSSDSSKNHWRSSKRQRTRSKSKTRSRSRSSSQRGYYYRRRSRSRSRSRYVSDHRRRRSRSRERSGSKRKRTFSPSSYDHQYNYNRSRASSSLLSWDQKRHRSKSSSVEITYVKRKKSKHKKKEKKHHKKHKSRKHKKRRRASESEDSQENTSKSVVRPRSLVTVVNKPKQPEQKPEKCSKTETENKTPEKDVSTNSLAISQSKSSVLDSIPVVSSVQTTPSDTKLVDSTKIEPADSKVSPAGSSDSKTSNIESNIRKPYKKHPTGHKKSSQNKTASQSTALVDIKHKTTTDTCSDSAQPSKSLELSPLLQSGRDTGPCTQSSEGSDGDVNEVLTSTYQRNHTKEVHTEDISPRTIHTTHVSCDQQDSNEVDKSGGNTSHQDCAPEKPKDSVNLNVSGDSSCVSDNMASNSSENECGACSSLDTDQESAAQSSMSASAHVMNTLNNEHVNQNLSTDSTNENLINQFASHGTGVTPDNRPDSDETVGKCQHSPCMFESPGVSAPQLGRQTSTIEILDSDSSINSDSDIDLLDCEGSAESGRNNNCGRSCVIVESPQNVTIGYPSDSATDYPRYSSDRDEISSTNVMSDTSIFSNTDVSQSQPSSPCLYSSPNLMYSSPMGTSLAISGFNSIFQSSGASIMRTDSFVSNMAVSISTAGVQSQHMSNHVYRASPGGQWESHHSAHSISRANMGNVELVQTMSGVAHNNLYGSTRSATSSTMAYIPHSSSGQYLPNATSVQTYTNTQQSYVSNAGQQYSPTSSPSQVLSYSSNVSPQASCSLNRNLLPIEGNSQTSLSPLPSYFTSSNSSNLWSQDRHIEVADSSEGDSDVDILFLSDNEDELREINIMDVTDEEESCGGGSPVDLVSDDSDVEIEEMSGPTDNVYEDMIHAVLPHESVSEAVLEDDAERTRRTTCDLSVFVSDEEDAASHADEQVQCASSSEEDNDLLYSASSSEDKVSSSHISSDKTVNEEEKCSSQSNIGVLKLHQRVSEETDYKGSSVFDCQRSGSSEELDKPTSSCSNSICHECGSEEEMDQQPMSNTSVTPHNSGSESDRPGSYGSGVLNHSSSQEESDLQMLSNSSAGCHKPGLEELASSSSNFICHDFGSGEHSTSSEGNTQKHSDADNKICDRPCRDDMISYHCDNSDKDSICGSSDDDGKKSDTYVSSESQSTTKETVNPVSDGNNVISDCVKVRENLVQDSEEGSSATEPCEGMPSPEDLQEGSSATEPCEVPSYEDLQEDSSFTEPCEGVPSSGNDTDATE